jgi:hypothetical protein
MTFRSEETIDLSLLEDLSSYKTPASRKHGRCGESHAPAMLVDDFLR